MAFYSQNLSAAWNQAGHFVAANGHIATLPDIINARLENPEINTAPWQHYFTTTSAEYVGYSPSGELVLIVAHGVGPLSTLAGIEQAYAWEYRDQSRRRRGGRITQEEFLDLYNGEYGRVEVVPLAPILERYKYPFIEILQLSQCLNEPLFQARLGADWQRYLELHAANARSWHAEQSLFDEEDRYGLPNWAAQQEHRRLFHQATAFGLLDPYILKLGDASCSYKHCLPEDGFAFAHLLTISQLSNSTHLDGGVLYQSLLSTVSCHDWIDGTRFVAVRGEVLSNIHPGVSSWRDTVTNHWQQLLAPVQEVAEFEFGRLIELGSEWFTHYSKEGNAMDSGEPEYKVLEMEELFDGPETFTTTTGAYIGFFKYEMNEVRKIAPAGANAYSFPGEIELGGAGHITPIRFYRVVVDTTRRLPHKEEVENNPALLISLLTEQL